MKKGFIDESLDLLERQCRDHLVIAPYANPTHRHLWSLRLQHTFETQVFADDEHCARVLTALDRELRRKITLHYRPAQGAESSEHGRWRSDGTMWIRPAMPSRMLMTMAHECGHMFTQLALGIETYADLPDPLHEVIAESVAFVVLRAVGVDTLEHSAAYVTNNEAGGGIAPGSVRDLIAHIAHTVIGLLPPSDLRGVA